MNDNSILIAEIEKLLPCVSFDVLEFIYYYLLRKIERAQKNANKT